MNGPPREAYRPPLLQQRGLRHQARGFTLLELLVAITVMALLGALSWRGLDGMARAQAQTRERADVILTLQAGLSQWKSDLDALSAEVHVNALDWDGRVLRLTRRTAVGADGLQVVAWSRRSEAGQWLRWQSPVIRSASDWDLAWRQAGRWAQSPGAEERVREVSITPLAEWQLFYYRGNAWTNPLSSDARQPAAAGPDAAAERAGAPGRSLVPEGIRLELVLPPDQPVSGKLTLDWVRPTLGGDQP